MRECFTSSLLPERILQLARNTHAVPQEISMPCTEQYSSQEDHITQACLRLERILGLVLDPSRLKKMAPADRVGHEGATEGFWPSARSIYRERIRLVLGSFHAAVF